MTSKQQYKIKSSVSNANSWLNGIFPSFDSLNYKFCLGSKLIDSFSSHFSFHKADHYSNKSKRAYYCKLDKLIFNTSMEPSTVIIVLGTSIKNNVTTSIAHIYSFNNLLKKILHYVINNTSTETELFVLRYRLDQVVQILDFSHIIVIIDVLYVAQKIFNMTLYPYQLQSIAISQKLWVFSNQYLNNSIEFWNCPSSENWHLHVVVNKETKNFNLIPLYPCKTLWNFNKKEDSNNIIKEWCKYFNMSDLKGRNFLNLLNNNYTDIVSSYTKGDSWLEQFGFSNLLYMQATWAITNIGIQKGVLLVNLPYFWSSTRVHSPLVKALYESMALLFFI